MNFDTPEQRAADAELLRAFDRTFSELEDDPTPLKSIDQVTLNTDGGVNLWITLADGRVRCLFFKPGWPIPSVGPKPKPPTQYATIRPYDERATGL